MTDSTDISEQDRDLFRRTVGPIKPIRQDRIMPGRADGNRRQCSGQRQEQDSDHEAATGLPETDMYRSLGSGDELFFKRPGIQQKVIRKLKRGQFRVEATADLHGETVAQARQSLTDFLRASQDRNRRCVLIIHGKGHGSANRKPVIKNKVDAWLRECSDVLAFCSARPGDGGTGAVYVLLRAHDWASRECRNNGPHE